EECGIIWEAFSRPVFATARPLSSDARRPGKMALRADAVAADGIELRRIHDIGACALTGGHLRDMSRSGSVAALAADACFGEGLGSKSILRARDRLQAACVALQAAGSDRTCEMDRAVLVIARRKLPFLSERIIRQR